MVIETGLAPSQLQENKARIAEFHKKHMEQMQEQQMLAAEREKEKAKPDRVAALGDRQQTPGIANQVIRP